MYNITNVPMALWSRKRKSEEIFHTMRKHSGGNPFLRDARLDVNALNGNGTTMLSYAAENGNREICEFLLQNGADADVANSDGSIPLHIAAQHGQINIVKLFLDKGISARSCDNVKNTALHHIAVTEDLRDKGNYFVQKLVHILVDRNADINAVNQKGCTPLLHAARVSGLCKHSIWRSCSRSCKYKGLYMVEMFIELGANVNCCDADKWTILHHACQNGMSGLVQTLVKGRFDIDLNAKTSNGSTPAIIAAHSSHQDIVKLLIESGADVKSKRFGGMTVLHFACDNGWLDVVKSLVRKGCYYNARTNWGVTPLIGAAIFSRSDVVEYLIECGADVESCNVGGWKLLHYACKEGWIEVVKSQTKKTSDVNAPTASHDTPLHLAISKVCNLEIVKYLLNTGADCNAENCFFQTPFNMFIHKLPLCLEVITLFILKGAYIQTDDYAVISNNSLLKEGILQNTQLCTVALVNKFNNGDLHKMYDIPGVSKRLPRIEKLTIARRSNVAHDIYECLEYEMQTIGYCNVLNVCPIVLKSLCVLTLAKYYNDIHTNFQNLVYAGYVK